MVWSPWCLQFPLLLHFESPKERGLLFSSSFFLRLKKESCFEDYQVQIAVLIDFGGRRVKSSVTLVRFFRLTIVGVT